MAVAAWAAASLFFAAVIRLSDIFGGHKSLRFILYANSVHFALWTLAVPFLSMCVRTFPVRIGNRARNVAVLVVIVASSGTVMAIAFWWIVFSTFFPYHQTYPTFRSLLETDLIRVLPVDVLVGLVIVVGLQGWRVWLDFQKEQTRAAELQRELAIARLDALRMQLHPHFLFNTLHTVAGLIVEEPTSARRMVIALGEFLRRTLKNNGQPSHTLAEEIEFADLYLGIQKLRLGDRLELNYEIDPEATRALVPCMLLQPLFENAIQHGAARVAGNCEIFFSAHRLGDRLQLKLQNGGTLRSPSAGPLRYGVGLSNTESRLRLHYCDQFTFSIGDRPTGGANVEISVPYESSGTNAPAAAELSNRISGICAF
jgi:two-component system LytT family sensor kinase